MAATDREIRDAVAAGYVSYLQKRNPGVRYVRVENPGPRRKAPPKAAWTPTTPKRTA